MRQGTLAYDDECGSQQVATGHAKIGGRRSPSTRLGQSLWRTWLGVSLVEAASAPLVDRKQGPVFYSLFTHIHAVIWCKANLVQVHVVGGTWEGQRYLGTTRAWKNCHGYGTVQWLRLPLLRPMYLSVPSVGFYTGQRPTDTIWSQNIKYKTDDAKYHPAPSSIFLVGSIRA